MAKKKKIPLKTILFAQLADIFEEVSVDEFTDKSANWIEVKLPGNKTLSIEFDEKKENIKGIGLYEDIYDIVDTKRLFYAKNKKNLRPS